MWGDCSSSTFSNEIARDSIASYNGHATRYNASDNQKVYENCDQTYDAWLTRGVIFTVDGCEISFEKQNWPYSEEINVECGYNLIDKFSDVNDFSEDWNSGIKAVVTRENVVLQ